MPGMLRAPVDLRSTDSAAGALSHEPNRNKGGNNHRVTLPGVMPRSHSAFFARTAAVSLRTMNPSRRSQLFRSMK